MPTMGKFHQIKGVQLRRASKYAGIMLLVLIAVFLVWQGNKKVPTDADWKDTLKLLSTAEFKGDLVTVHNVRNFQYIADGVPKVENYYDRTYDLSKLTKIWFVADPFHPGSLFAHTFLSFEFSDGNFLAITIEGRLTKEQEYTIHDGLLRTYPLIYIAADERDALYVRTNVAKNDMYLYPIKATPAQARLLLVDMLQRMNELSVNPVWYNAVTENCTSSIADHVDKIWPGLLPRFDWQTLFTNYADKLLIDKRLIDTTLPFEEARKKFYVTDKAQKIGYRDDFSTLIRQ